MFDAFYRWCKFDAPDYAIIQLLHDVERVTIVPKTGFRIHKFPRLEVGADLSRTTILISQSMRFETGPSVSPS